MSIIIDPGAPWIGSATTNVATIATNPSTGSGGVGHTWVAMVTSSGAGAMLDDASVSGGGLTWTRRLQQWNDPSAPAANRYVVETWTATGICNGTPIVYSVNSNNNGGIIIVYACGNTQAESLFPVRSITNVSAAQQFTQTVAAQSILLACGTDYTGGGQTYTLLGNTTLLQQITNSDSDDCHAWAALTPTSAGSITWGTSSPVHPRYVLAGIEILSHVPSPGRVAMTGLSTVNAIPSINTLDFGIYGSNEASMVVTGQTGILSGSQVEAWLMSEPYGAGTVHTAADQSYAANFIKLTCGNIIPGVGFTIYGRSLERISGKWKVQWFWA